MSRLQNLIIFVILAVLLFAYCLILKTKPGEPEPSMFRETNMLPELTFSKLADFENRMVVELDAISMEEYERIRNPSFPSEPVPDYSMMQVVVFISFSIVGIIVVLCAARWFYIKEDGDFYREHFSSSNALSSQEKLFRSYETTQN